MPRYRWSQKHLVGAYEEWARESVYYFLNTRVNTVWDGRNYFVMLVPYRADLMLLLAEDFLPSMRCTVPQRLVSGRQPEQLVDRRSSQLEDSPQARDAKKDVSSGSCRA